MTSDRCNYFVYCCIFDKLKYIYEVMNPFIISEMIFKGYSVKSSAMSSFLTHLDVQRPDDWATLFSDKIAEMSNK